MSRTRRLLLLPVLLAAPAAATAATAAPPNHDPAALLASVCSGCHGQGSDTLTDISTLTAATLNARFNAYRSTPGNTVMHRLARGYTADEIKAIANHLAAPPPVPPSPPAPPPGR